MSLGVNVTSRSAPPARGAETDTGAWHVVGLGGTGTPDVASTLHSLADYVAVHGARTTGNALVYDSLDAYFREGGRTAHYVSAVDATTYAAALAALPDVPGQVSLLDPTPSAAHWALLNAHCQAFNKRALYDEPDGDTVSALETLSASLPADHLGAEFGPWAQIPGIGGGAARDIPASPVVAALCARVDATGNPNQAAAGRHLGLQYVTGLKAERSMADINTLNAAGMNSLALVFGVLENYGFDTPIGLTGDPVFGQFNCSRTEMYLIANAKSIGENYMFKTIDGNGHLASDLASELGDLCLDLYRAGGLFGSSPQEAFSVDVTTVNDPSNVAQGKLTAVLSTHLSLHARDVEIQLVSVPVNVAL